MSQIKVNYFKGWLKSESIDGVPNASIEWAKSWVDAADKEKQRGKTLVVFSLPDTNQGYNAIAKIEKLLQDTFGK